MRSYFNYLISNKTYGVKKKKKTSKKKTIIKWNNFYSAIIHQGRHTNVLTQVDDHIGFKFGEFTKTRKPFFFRGKKKK